jgi:hypothetical protein
LDVPDVLSSPPQDAETAVHPSARLIAHATIVKRCTQR